MKRILVFSPHPDDDIIGCGGSMAKHVSQGNEVTAVYLTSGEAGSLKHPPEVLAQKREAEAAEAGRVIGVSDVVFLQNPDGYLEYNQDNIVKLTNLIRKRQPHLVYLPHRGEPHPDHFTTNQLGLEACRRSGGPWFAEYEGQPWTVEAILGYEVWTTLSEAGYIEDITKFMGIKLSALNCHKSQLEDIRYDEAVKGLNRYRGIMSGKGDYCECFQVIKASRLY